MCGAGRYTALRIRRETWFCEQPTTEAMIVVAIRRACGTILLAGLCHQSVNLPCRFGERALVGPHTGQTARADQRAVRWRIARQFGISTLPSWRSPIARGQIDIQADSVNHYEVDGRNIGDAQSKDSTRPFVALTGDQALFFRDQPKRRIARPNVHSLKVVVWSAFQRLACSVKVASGNWSSWKRSVASCAAEILALLPRRGLGAREPLVWRKRNQRLMLPRLT